MTASISGLCPATAATTTTKGSLAPSRRRTGCSSPRRICPALCRLPVARGADRLHRGSSLGAGQRQYDRLGRVQIVPKRRELSTNALLMHDAWTRTGAASFWSNLLANNHGAGLAYEGKGVTKAFNDAKRALNRAHRVRQSPRKGNACWDERLSYPCAGDDAERHSPERAKSGERNFPGDVGDRATSLVTPGNLSSLIFGRHRSGRTRPKGAA